MGEKDLKIKVGENLGISEGNVKAELKIASTVKPPHREPVIRYFSSSTSSGDIVEETIQDIQKAGYKLEPKTVRFLIKGVEDIKDLGVGFKIGGNLSLEGGAGGSFEKSPSKQTEKYTEYQIEISFEVKKED